MPSGRLLIADDEEGNREFLAEALQLEGYQVTTAKDGEEAIKQIEADTFDVVLTDLKMPKATGIEVLKAIQRTNSEAVGVVFTAFGTIESAVQAMKAGAADYISKPFHLDEIRIVVRKALEFRRLKGENQHLKRQLRQKYRFDNLIGDSENMQRVYRMIEKVADTDSTVLILGESGTGKELVARALHYNSRRQDRPLVPVNCGAIPEDLLESELFGHVKGSFTGALNTRIGRFELASGGTIFLDEIGDMSPNLQVKLLRVLQEQEFEPIGSTKTVKVSVRVIAATHQNLEEVVAKRTFREDLYYRLNVIPIHLPPLRERCSDIPLLVEHFLARFKKEKQREVVGLDPGVMEWLQRYPWPGNVRELENMIERMVILKVKDTIGLEDLPENLRSKDAGGSSLGRLEIPEAGIDLKRAVNDFERELILQALRRSNWVKNKAAKLLQLNRTTLVEKMKKIELTRAAS
ncbi:MAG: sigma-54-dependent Fis family transcriptional regulator [Candidatus Tectomicrobia bacterium]|nr:sigma-54-dependent Fis family transcriptional regulator [Candidatus Tectomicrobia bacterium]